MGRHDHYDEDESYRSEASYIGRKLKKKLRVCGCGCGIVLLLATVLIVLVLTGIISGAKTWVVPALRGIGSQLPKNIPLPEGMRLPALPPGILKLTPEEQIQLGREVAKQEGIDQKAFVDPTIDATATRLVKALPAQYRGPQGSGWEWRFRGVRTTEGTVNAIALPGGKVYLYDGLLKLTENNPDQIALVLGHEMAHVVEEHYAEQLRSAGLLQTAVDLMGGGAEGGEGQGQSGEVIRLLATKLGKQVVSMQLSQSVEFQADALGMQFMRNAGYDPKRGLRILERMDQLAQLKGAGNPMLGCIFSTHPPMPERLQKLQQQISTP